MTGRHFTIGDRTLAETSPVFVVAELSGNHGGDLGRAVEIIHQAADAGADAVKLQTYTADTMTIASDRAPFRVEQTVWAGRNLHDLYQEASTPWEWHERLFAEAKAAGLQCFSTAFDASSVDFLDELGVPIHKIASFELTDLPLIDAMARTGKPLMMSTGMATTAEIDAAVRTARDGGAPQVLLLRCNSAYPASPAEMDLASIPVMSATWDCLVGLSDHTPDAAAALTATALGARVLEKHLTLDRADGGPDASFSLEPAELARTVRMVRDGEAAMGTVRFGPSPSEVASLAFRRSLFVVAPVAAGERFTSSNVRVIRPAAGLPPAQLDIVLGRRAAAPIEAGTPLSWDLID